MGRNMLDFLLPEPVGCCLGPEVSGAGCDVASSGGQAAEPLPDADASTGCAASCAADVPGQKAVTPPNTVREFERALRQLGFSRTQAEDIARHGFKGAYAAPPDGDTDTVIAADASVKIALGRLSAAMRS